MDNPIAILRKNGLLGRKVSVESVISSISLSKIVDICTEIDQTIISQNNPVINPIFSHSSSLNLSGSDIKCSFIDCRIERIMKLARFALMYSDKVFISNSLSQYRYFTYKDDLPYLRKKLLNDIKVLSVVAPLIEKDYIRLFSTHTNVCFSCQAKYFLGENFGRRYSINYKILKKNFLDHISAECEHELDNYWLKISGPPPYFDHAYVKKLKAFPPAIIERPRILQRIQKCNKVSLSKSLIRDLKLDDYRAHIVASNAIHGLATSSCLNTTFLTEDDLDISFLNSLYESPNIRKKNLIAAKHLSSIVPFLENVSLSDIIKLRKREKEAFILYRQAMNEAIDNFKTESNSFTERDAHALYGDIIEPRLTYLDKKVKQAKRDLVRKPFRSLTSLVGVISFGLLTGLVSPGISALAKAVGIVKYGGDLIKDTMAIGDKEQEIQNDHFYFLWKVKKKTKRNRKK